MENILPELELIREEMNVIKNLMRLEELIERDGIEVDEERLVRKDIQMRRLESGSGITDFERFRTARVPFQLDLDRVRRAAELAHQAQTPIPLNVPTIPPPTLQGVNQMWRMAAAPERRRIATPRQQNRRRLTRRGADDEEDELDA